MTAATNSPVRARWPVPGAGQAGFLPVAVVAMLVPIVVLVSAAAAALTGRSQRQRGEVDAERALHAAEAGIDEAIFRLNTGAMPMGTAVHRELLAGLRFAIVAVDQGNDGLDNDSDGVVDEADEGEYRVAVTGSFRRTKRKLEVMVSHCLQPVTATAGATVTNPSLSVSLAPGLTRLDGRDRRLDGTPLPASNRPAMTIQRPGTVDDLLAKFSGATDPSAIAGLDGAGCLAPSADVLDLPALVDGVRRNATSTLGATVADASHGDGRAGTWEALFREGSLSVTGTSSMAGVLVVTGDLEVSGSFRFDGLLVVGGNLRLSGDAAVYGAVVCQGTQLAVEDQSRVLYCSEALQWPLPRLAQWAAAGSLRGWREVAKD